VNNQWEVDRLVNLGVLNKIDLRGIAGDFRQASEPQIAYFLVKEIPHTHNWSVFYAKSGPEDLFLVCNVAHCSETRSIPNHGLFPGIN